MQDIRKIMPPEGVLILGSFGDFRKSIDKVTLNAEDIIGHINAILAEYHYDSLELPWLRQKMLEMATFGFLKASGDGYIITMAGMIAHNDASQLIRDMYGIIEHVENYNL